MHKVVTLLDNVVSERRRWKNLSNYEIPVVVLYLVAIRKRNRTEQWMRLSIECCETKGTGVYISKLKYDLR
jgi:hypothetical protein